MPTYPQVVPILIPRLCEDVSLYGKTIFAYVSKLRILR